MRSIESWTLRRPPKSQLAPVNSGVPLADSGLRLDFGLASTSVSGTDAPFGKEFMEHREDLRRIADSPHGEMLMRRRDLVIGAPQIAVARQAGEAAAGPVADLDIGEILAQRQHIATQQRHAAA